MRELSSRLGWLILLLAVVWIVVFWVTPGPEGWEESVRIRYDDQVSPGVSYDDGVVGGEDAAEEMLMGEPVVTVPPVLEDVESEHLEEVEEASGWGIVPPSARVYLSQRGDTLEEISRRFYGTTGHWRAIARMNDIDPNRLGPGTRLLIPLDPGNVQGLPEELVEERTAGETVTVAEESHTEYIVSRGDTLSEISKALYGRASLWRRIADANPEIDPDRLRLGAVLKIPPPPALDER